MEADLVMEERVELMVSPTGGQGSVRRAHFLKPIVTSAAGPVAGPSLSCPAAAEYKDLPLNVCYQGCKTPPKDWENWVDRMHSLHHSTWKNAGIVDAIMNSKCIIHRYDDLIFRFLEKWCVTTNSFVFPWGEASVTLEDIMVLGGYPVLGEGVLVSAADEEMEQVVKKLQKSRSNITKSCSRKATQGKWMAQFRGSGREIEHEAFLAYWLSKFVFPFARDTISRDVVTIAAHLARGSKIALAPAVLSAIYKGLGMLKAAIAAAARKSGTGEDSSAVQVTVPALALVQVWIWERFPSLRPKPPVVVGSKPGLARWHNLKMEPGHRSLLTIDSVGKDFQWRPYAAAAAASEGEGEGGMIYMRDDEHWGSEDLMGFVRCVRTSELVSLQHCIEQYLPHRVAMQFGMDQDLPGYVARVNVNPEIAWSDYSRPIRDAKIYVPPRVSQPCVTARYAKWWKKLSLGWSWKTTDTKIGVKKELFPGGGDDVPPPPGFSPKMKKKEKRAEDDIIPLPPPPPPPHGFSPERKKKVEDWETPPPKHKHKHKHYGVRLKEAEAEAAQVSSKQEESKVKCEEESGKSRALGKQLEEKIRHIEKLVRVLKAGGGGGVL
ncbi:hypothetical protein ACS0TY_030834 [Phlomoides rotata]